MKYVNTNGKRNEYKLTYEQRKECLEYIELLGFEHDISFSEYSNTAFACSSEDERIALLKDGLIKATLSRVAFIESNTILILKKNHSL